MFDNRLLALLNHMINMPHLSIWKLGVVLDQPVEQLEEDIQELNDVLGKIGYSKIEIKEGEYRVPQSLICKQKELQRKLKNSQIYLQENEREHLIYLYTFIRKEEVSNYHYQELLKVSKNTTLADIKKLRKRCEDFQINLKYTRSKGYYLEGNELDKRRMAFISISSLQLTPIGSWALNYIAQAWNEEIRLDELKKELVQCATEKHIHFVENRLSEVVGLIYFVFLRQKRVKIIFTNKEKLVLKESSVNEISETIVTDFFKLSYSEDETSFLTMVLLGIAEGDSVLYKDEKLYQITKDIISKMEKIAVIDFRNKNDLQRTLYTHIVPTYYRLLFGLKLENSMVNQIKREHNELFGFVKQALKPLQEIVNSEITDEEIAYFTIHFGGQFEKTLKQVQSYRALVICPNGISSSLILRSELKQLFPQINWLGEHSIEDLKLTPEDSYDMIFSTVYIRTEKKLYIVKPIMNQRTKNYLLQIVTNDFELIGSSNINIEDLMLTIKKYSNVTDEEKLYKALSKKLLTPYEEEREELPMLEDLITNDTIQFIKDENLTWEEAIRLSSDLLINKNYIEESYVEAIIANVKKYGAFIDLGQGIAIPHARPENGVNQLGMSLLKLEKPVYLLDDPNHGVNIIITLAAIDNQSHLKALSQLTKILSDKEKITVLKEATTKEEILNLIKENQEVEDND
ncbi:transcriptional antiterminator, BglG family [Carnobacterium iners]|uniref:Ascorbate-specific PTS system EIIA component n=1 Tax=Carnobacterium iners TaxID=1073423 RepID=A0A1X7NAC7_9LACT|nr:BglG family transcription antiterminator [Carnobacterium iners]SEK51109.1 transcriptional antiterminator, BglG family [Carnobacterium iners]SMH34530.1 transcriptional antiterminator, BglG family [Carnobacterium iners]